LRIIVVVESEVITIALDVITGERLMKLKKRLMKLYKDVSRKALREPRTLRELAIRMKWERLRKILWRRYDYM